MSSRAIAMLSVATFGLAASGAAFAADLATKMPVKAPPPVPAPIYGWTGWYAGLNAGYAWQENNSIGVTGTPNFVSGLNGAPQGLASAVAGATTVLSAGNGGGFIGGGQIGYNYQVGQIVAGLEADIQGLTGKASGTTANTVPFTGFPPLVINTSIAGTNSVDWLGTLRGRLGYTVTPSFLIYGTGGVAYGGVRSGVIFNQQVTGAPNCTVCVPYGFTSDTRETRVGYAIGAGAEWMMASQWSAKAEYLHYDLGSVSSTGAASNIAQPPNSGFPTYYTVGATASTRISGDFVRVGLNYHFH